MNWPILVVVLIFVLTFIALMKINAKRNTARANEFPYIKNRALFSPVERSLLGVLEQAVGTDYRIFGKVCVADVVGVQPMNARGAWWRAFNRISAKHFDFVLCDRSDLAVRCIVELNDTSHNAHERRERDDFLENVCRTISLPLIQIQARRDYSVIELRKRLLAALSANSIFKITDLEPPFSVGRTSDRLLNDQPWTMS